MKNYLSFLFALVFTSSLSQGVNTDKKRADELKIQMWSNADKDFLVTEVPEKWKNEQAVVLAKSNTLFYRKEVIVANLYYDRYTHVRVKLLSTKAIEDYAQFKIESDSRWGSSKLESFAGFKIIKADGRQIEVPLSEAVKETETYNGAKQEIYKLAIPNLVIGDILDYYLVREETIALAGSRLYTFDPVFFQLHGEYPILKQKISFDVLRRCYINIKSLNGAPTFKLTADGKDKEKSHYYLEDANRESVKDIRWMYPYRELPAVKFKVTYASTFVAGQVPFFIGEPGVLKSSVNPTEVKDLLAFYFRYSLSSYSSPTLLRDYMKKFKAVKDPEKLAKEAYYGLRNISLVQPAENFLLENSVNGPRPENNLMMVVLSDYFKSKKIPHDFLIGISRDVSSIDDLIFENEMNFMIKVNTPKPFYIGRFDANSYVGEIDPDLQGETVYSGIGLGSPDKWNLQKVKVPVVDAKLNNISTSYQISLSDLTEGVAVVQAKKTIKGINRIGYQNELMDFYTYRDEEKARFEMKESKSLEKKMVKKRNDFMASRSENFKNRMKEIVDNDFDLTVEDVSEPKIEQTGRWEEKPEMIFSYQATLKGMTKRAGPNYLVEIGKFIEEQTTIAEEEKNRKFNVYFPVARSFDYEINFTIPTGYSLTGIEKLNTKVDNEVGSFVSSAKVDGNKLVLTATKTYKTNYTKKENWDKVVSFVQAVSDFTKMQVVLEKK
jgi:hypothetical protein